MAVKEWILRTLAGKLAKKIPEVASRGVTPEGEAGPEYIPEVTASLKGTKFQGGTKEQYQEWISQQGAGVKAGQGVGTWWAQRKARAAGDMPEEKKTPSFLETLRGGKSAPQGYQPPWEREKKKSPWAYVGIIVALLLSSYYVLYTPAGSQLLGTGIKSTSVVSPQLSAAGAGLGSVWGFLVEGKVPEQTFQSEKIVEPERRDVGISIKDVKPRRDVYISPSVVEIEGRLTAVSPTDSEVEVDVTAVPNSNVFSLLGVTEEPQLNCQIQGAEGGKIKATALVNRRFVCSSTPQKYTASTLAGEQAGTVKAIPIDVTATIMRTKTDTTKTIYFTTDDTLSRVSDPATYFKIPKEELTGKQAGDTSVELGIGLVGSEDVIAVADPKSALISDYVLGVSVKNPTFTTGSAEIIGITLQIEAPPATIVTDEMNDFDYVQESKGIQSYKIRQGGAVLKVGESKIYYLKFKIPASELRGSLGSFRAKADLTYNYITPAVTTVIIKAVQPPQPTSSRPMGELPI